MKKLIVVISLISAISVLSINANAGAPSVQVSNIVQMQLDKNSMQLKNVIGGSIHVNKNAKTVALMLYRKAPECRPGALCAMYMPGPIVVELPITSIEVTSCGAKIYHGKLDQRAVDGDLQTLNVTDNSRFTCITAMATPAVEATYTVVNQSRSGHAKSTSRFIGSALKTIAAAY